ncbi:hypothetical protein G155_00217 [Mycobacterium sp. VKM Ac-1817D]|nr:hypothetical protein G155_00217 [Mycobacterium sp. VKM Ac-1817D]
MLIGGRTRTSMSLEGASVSGSPATLTGFRSPRVACRTSLRTLA